MALNDVHKELNVSALDHHNKLRALHGSPKLTIDWTLAKSAQAYADKLAKTNSFSHSNSNGEYGENLASSFNSREGYIFTGEAATQNWYDEIKDYKFGHESQQNSKIGHFSQVVWKETTTAGFGRAKSKSGNFIIVGQYKPAGNFMGSFLDNIKAPLGAAPRIQEPKLDISKPNVTKVKESNTPIKSTQSKPSTEIKVVTKPKHKDDRLVKSSTRTLISNGKKTIEVTETFQSSDGSSYEQKKTTISK